MVDDPIVISSGQVITPESVMSRSFTAAFRGYHPAEVRQFLKRVSDEMAASAAREAELRRALQEALARAAHPDLDEATVTRSLGDHAARVLATARETAASITAEAQQRSDALLRDTEAHAARVNQEAESVLARRMAEAEAATEGVQHTAGAEIHDLREQARAEAEALIEAARVQGLEMVTEARALRERMLDDLARRRRAAQLQVEQLRAARDRLLSAYEVVRRTLDEATVELTAAEPEARMAAEAVARRAETSDAPLRPEPPDAAVAGTDRPLALGTDMAQQPAQPAVREREHRAVASSGGPDPAQGGPRRPAGRQLASLPDRPPMRPQTVADAAAGRRPAPAQSPGARLPPARATPNHPPPPPPPPTPTPPNKVEELFTRLRAERSQVTSASAASPPPADAPSPAPAQAPVDGRPPAPKATPGLDPVVSETALTGRDEQLDNVESGLARALKRVLQNEQNAVLDSLRRLGAAGAVLPEPEAHLATYRETALPWLEQAARAGAGFVSPPGQDAGSGGPPVAVDAHALALAGELVEPLRERLQRALADTAGSEDSAVAVEGVRTVYRQWKAQQMDDAARHHAAAAFSAGAFAATPAGTDLLWVVDDDGHCPDCDDNALAGPTSKGQPFPTGQLHPPAHRGCRCLLVASTS